MSRELDERIVAMYFDNSNFEKNAQQTIKTLDELKDSCNMSGVEKGFDVFEQVGKKLNFEKITKSATKFKTVLSGFRTVMKKAFSIGPLDELKRGLENFKNNYFDKIFGFDIANKLVNSLENAFRSLTIQPITAGWSQYENTMDSVKTIMSSTGESIDIVKLKLGEMTDYANQTIYSLNDMTSNLGKFTNNGVKLDDATNAMIGLANATADAGQGAHEASMAMYNVSQAIGVGKMTTIDWKSLENANIATSRLKQTFIETAAALGQLEKRVAGYDQNGQEIIEYWTKGANAEKVTTENFRETLSKNWLTKEAMMATFSIYSNQLSISDIQALLGVSEEEAIRLKQIGENAYEAATQVRTFKKMMDALGESVQSTWATTFEYIFGDMEEGTNLWTRLSDEIDGILSAGAKARNDMLISWRGMMTDENGEVKRIEDIYKWRREQLIREHDAGVITDAEFGRRMNELEATLGDTTLWTDYREVAIDTLFEVIDIFKELGSMVKGAWEDVFGSLDSNVLKNITAGIKDFVDRVKVWLGSTDDAGSRISKLRRIFVGFFSIIKAGWETFKTGLMIVWNIIKPVIDPVLSLLARIGDFFNLKDIKNLSDIVKTLVERFKNFWNTLKQLGFSGVMVKIGDWFKDIWQNIKTGVTTFLRDAGLGGIVDFFKNIRDKIVEGYEAVKEWWDDPGNTFSGFFKGIWESIVNWFTPGENGEEVPIVKFFTNIYDWIVNAWNTTWTSISEWWNGGENEVAKFFTVIWEAIVGWFTPGTDGEDIPIVQFFKNIYEWIVGAWNTIYDEFTRWWNGGENDIAKFFTGIWEAIVGWFTPGTDGEDIPIVQFFKNIYGWIVGAWESVYGELTKWWNGGDNDIAKFFTGMWETISGWFAKEKKLDLVVYDSTGRHEYYTYEKAPIVEFFESILEGLKTAWDAIVHWSGWTDIGNFFKNTWDWLMSIISPDTSKIEEAIDNISGAIPGVRLRGTVGASGGSDSGGLGSEPIREGSGESKGKINSYEDIDDELRSQSPIIDFFMRIYEALSAVWDKITGWDGWDAIGKFFSDTWNWVHQLLTSKETSINSETGETEEGLSIIEAIGEFVKGIIEAVADLIRDIAQSGAASMLIRSLSDIFGIVSDIIKIITDWMERIIDKISGVPDSESGFNFWDWFIPAMTLIFTIFMKILELRKLKSLTSITDALSSMDSIGMQILEIGASIMLIAMAIEKLGNMPQPVLGQGLAFVVIVGVVISVLVALITKLKKTLSDSNVGNEPTKAWERVVGKLITALAMVGMIWLVLDKLPSIIEALSEAKKYSGLDGSDVFNTLLGVLTLVGGMMLSFAVVQRILPKGLEVGATAKTVLSVFAALAIAIGAILGTGGLLELIDGIVDAIAGEDVDSMEAITGAFKKVAVFVQGLGDVVNAFIKGLFGYQSDGEKVDASLKSLESMGTIADDFDLNKTTGILRIMNMMSRLTEVSKDINVEKLDNFSIAMGSIGDALNKFAFSVLGSGTPLDNYIGAARLINDEDAYEKMSEYITLVTNLMGIFTPLEGFAVSAGSFSRTLDSFIEFTTGNGSDEKLANFIKGVNNLLHAMEDLDDGSGISFNGIDIIQKLFETIQNSFDDPSADIPEFNAQPIVDAIVKAIGIEDQVIGWAIHDMVQRGLNLVNSGVEGISDFDVSSILDIGNIGNFLSLPDTSSYVNDMTEQAGELVGGLQGKMEDAAAQMQEGFNIKLAGIDMADSNGDGIPDVMDTLQSQFGDLQTMLDENDSFSLTFRPVLNINAFQDQVQNLRSYLSGEAPLSLATTIALGDNTLPIDDANIMAGMERIRTEVENNRRAMETSLLIATSDLGSRINSLAGHIDNLKLTLNGQALVGGIISGVDRQLYNRSWQSEMTGVSNP